MKINCICDTETKQCDCNNSKYIITTTTTTSHSNLSSGAIIGIAIGSIVLVGIITYLAYKRKYNFIKKKYGKRRANLYRDLGLINPSPRFSTGIYYNV